MKCETVKIRRNVREGYQVLLRAEAELLLPEEEQLLRDFYQKVAEACLNWVTDVEGERLREAFRTLETVRDKSHFSDVRYRFRMKIPWEKPPYVCVVCESEHTQKGSAPKRFRISHLWNLTESTILPFSQVLQLFNFNLSKSDIISKPDGVYPEGNDLVFFRNPTGTCAGEECRIPANENRTY